MKPLSKGKPKKELKEKTKEKFSVETMVEALVAAKGIKWNAAKRLGCARKTVTNYIRRHPEVAAAYKQEREKLIDLAEDGLITKLNRGYWPSIKFALSTIGKDRGYTERTEVTGAEGGAILIDRAFQTALDRVYGEGELGPEVKVLEAGRVVVAEPFCSCPNFRPAPNTTPAVCRICRKPQGSSA